MLVIGIDPGSSGGIAWQKIGDRIFSGAEKFPDSETDAKAILANCMTYDRDWFAYIERVGATPQMGVTSAFTFGRNYGLLRGLLIGLGIPFDEVQPAKWSASVGLPRGKKLGTGDTERHNAIKAKAQQLFPWLQVTHAKAAALLIAEHGVRIRMGEQQTA